MTLVLLWGLEGEAPLTLVREALTRKGVPTAVLDQREILQTEIELRVDGTVTGLVRTPGQRIDLETVSGLYVRPYDTRHLPAVRQAGPGSAAWRHATAVEYALWCWAEVAPGVVVNRPAAQASNGSKPYQLDLIRRAGFAVPETLITTDPQAAQSFWERHGAVIYKSVSSVRSQVTRLGPRDRPRLEHVAWCPTQFQAFVPGHDYRVHVAGREVFASRISAPVDDYRYPGDQEVEVRPAGVPPELARRCRRLAHGLGLPLAGIDLRCTPDGEWYCFEVNPSPGFAYYERATGQPISQAIARLLAGDGSQRDP
jgi:glutathione synthase/RimK-type ligase-like ATP-grasp enzyme